MRCKLSSPAWPDADGQCSLGWLGPQNSSVGGGPSALWQGWTGARMPLSPRIHTPIKEARPGRAAPSSGSHLQAVQEPKPGASAGVAAAAFISLKATAPREGNKHRGVQTAGLTWGRRQHVFKGTFVFLTRSQQTVDPQARPGPPPVFIKFY